MRPCRQSQFEGDTLCLCFTFSLTADSEKMNLFWSNEPGLASYGSIAPLLAGKRKYRFTAAT